jgi:hypothetical protein
VLQSHTATQQWQSFEIRMRRRRVERCLLRASVALEAGVLEDVRAALEEVERLDPYEPTLHPLTAQLALAEARLSHSARETPAVVAPAVAARAGASAPVSVTLAEVPLVQSLQPELMIAQAVDRPRAGRAAAYAIAALLVAISGAGGWFYVTGLPPAVQPTTRPHPPALQQSNGAAAGVAPEAAPAVRVSETAVAAAPTVEAAPAEAAPVATAGPDRAADASAGATVPPPPPLATAASETGKPAPLRTTEPPATTSPAANAASAPPPVIERPRALEPTPSLPEPPPVAPVAIAGADGVALTDTSVNLTPPPVLPPAAAAPAPPPAAPAPAPQNDERLVRALLGRYEAAYSALDAAAASRVWPTVDRRALASAFDGLQSQSVSLGRCDVRMAGATAQAECRGTARWNPKVGGGPQTASRQWHFELRSTGGDWIITRATVR